MDRYRTLYRTGCAMKDLPDKRALWQQVQPSRDKWDPMFRPSAQEPVRAGEESVWDYPRPPIIEYTREEITVRCNGFMIAKSDIAAVVKETAGAPVPYLPLKCILTDCLSANDHLSVCEWKGVAVSHDVLLPDGQKIADAAWTYPDPFDDLPQGYAAIAGWFAFYPGKLECYVGQERVRPQPGGFYGGWVTDRVKGPIKGAPGTGHW